VTWWRALAARWRDYRGVGSSADRQEKAVEQLLWKHRFERIWLVVATLFMLAAIPVLAWQARQTAHLANPTIQEVVDRLIRGVNSMNRQEAREVIDTMTRKAAQGVGHRR
jgi:nitrous oxidase accessory protein NosD